jgi:diaminopimelate epimerase
MRIPFSKYQGTGNDFILIDDRFNRIDLSGAKIKSLCDRKFGIGADGLILLQNDSDSDFRMTYYNSDGNESSMCGNGGRCITAFAKKLGIINQTTCFNAVDGIHEANCNDTSVSLGMKNVSSIEKFPDYFFLDTGSPHVVKFIDDIDSFAVVEEAKKIRFSPKFSSIGTNVNFVQMVNNKLLVRTYERGVEGETLSCGTGVTASALVAHHRGLIQRNNIVIQTPGGELSVQFVMTNPQHYEKIFLTGPATFVFEGWLELN